MYVKNLSNTTVSGLLVREEDARLQVRFKIDTSVYDRLFQSLTESRYIKISVSEGMIVGIGTGQTGQEFQTGHEIEDKILSLLKNGSMEKQKVYKQVKEVGSYKTFQRLLNDMTKTGKVRKSHHKVWVVKI